MPKSPEPTTINSVLESFRNRFGNYGLYQDEEYMGYKDVFKEVEGFLKSVLSKTCDEILGVIRERDAWKTKEMDGSECECGAVTVFDCSCEEWNAARKAIESKIRELKGL